MSFRRMKQLLKQLEIQLDKEGFTKEEVIEKCVQTGYARGIVTKIYSRLKASGRIDGVTTSQKELRDSFSEWKNVIEEGGQKTLQDIIEQIKQIDLQTSKAEAEVKSAEVDLATSRQRGTHNSCWRGSSPELNNACLERYKIRVKQEEKLRDEYKNLKLVFGEQLRVAEEEARLQAEQEELAQAETVEVEIDCAGDQNKVEHDLEMTID